MLLLKKGGKQLITDPKPFKETWLSGKFQLISIANYLTTKITKENQNLSTHLFVSFAVILVLLELSA